MRAGVNIGGAEALAGALRSDDRALIIGQSSAGRAAEYTDSPLSGGKILRIGRPVCGTWAVWMEASCWA